MFATRLLTGSVLGLAMLGITGAAFDDLPADPGYVYLPGANFGGVHYPGSRLRLSTDRSRAEVELAIRDTIETPCPLELRRHDIQLQADGEAVRVTETMLIENPTTMTYVGHADQKQGRATTLSLTIPADFRRVTFDKEFFGRQFTLIDEHLVTDIPWTPGRRELKFSYVVPNPGLHQQWTRPLDLPCDCLRIEVQATSPDEISSNLSQRRSDGRGRVIFETGEQRLPAGHVVHVNLDGGSFSLAEHGRWFALAVLLTLAAGTLAFKRPLMRRRAADIGTSARGRDREHARRVA